MFPLMDNTGRAIGFSARIFGSEDSAPVAKYINSPETPLYNKSRTLYLYHRARLPFRTVDRCILVEGQVDALLSQQSGFLETVAVSGTALTKDHLEMIKRLTGNLIMAFDADLAGIRAGRRAIELALDQGLEVKIALLPTNRDPADLIRENPERWRQAIDQAVHVVDFLLTTLKREWSEPRRLAHAVEREVYPFLIRLLNPIDQAFFINKISVQLNLPENVIREGVARLKTQSQPTINSNPPPTELPNEKISPLVRRERLEEVIFGLLFWQNRPAWENLVRARLTAALYAVKFEDLSKRRMELALTAELAYGQSDKLDLDLAELLDYWQEESWREELTALLARSRSALPEEAINYANQCQVLLGKINSLKKL